MSEYLAKDQFLLDKRVVSRNILAGRISKQKVDQYLANIEETKEAFDDISEQIFDETVKGRVSGDFVEGKEDGE